MRIYRPRKKIIWAVIILLIIVGYFVAPRFFKNPADLYITEKVGRGEVLQEVSETGSVKATENLSLGFKTIGKIASINVAVGNDVKKGSVLAQLDPSQISAQLESAKAALKSAAKKYDKLLNGSTREEIKTYENAVAAAKDNLESAYSSSINTLNDAYIKIYNSYTAVVTIYNSYFSGADQPSSRVQENKDDINDNMKKFKTVFDSAQASLKDGDVDIAVSQALASLLNVYNDLKTIREQCDNDKYYSKVSSTDKSSIDTQKGYINTALTNVTSSQQDISSYKIALKTAEDNLAKQTAEPRSEDIDIYRSDVEEAQANLDLYQSQLNDLYLRSPINGKVTAVNAKRGETVSANESVVNLLSAELFQIKANIYEQDIVNVRTDNKVKITLVAFPKQTFEGKVLLVDPGEKIIDNVVYYEVTIDFPNQPDGVKSGMTADIVVETNKKENVLRVPKSVVEKIDGKEFLQVVNKGKIENRTITTGLEGNDYFEVLSGISEGDEVIIGKK